MEKKKEKPIYSSCMTSTQDRLTIDDMVLGVEFLPTYPAEAVVLYKGFNSHKQSLLMPITNPHYYTKECYPKI